MTSRDEILARVRRNQPAPQPLPSLPAFERQAKAPLASFKANLLRMGGKFVELSAFVDINTAIIDLFPKAKVI